jgi:hypothetical protein
VSRGPAAASSAPPFGTECDAGQLKLLRETREIDVSRGELVGKIRELLGV